MKLLYKASIVTILCGCHFGSAIANDPQLKTSPRMTNTTKHPKNYFYNLNISTRLQKEI